MRNTQPLLTDDEIAAMLVHLDDETEWENVNEFWNAWGPRQTDRIERLLLAAQKARADLAELRADILRAADSYSDARTSLESLCEDVASQRRR